MENPHLQSIKESLRQSGKPSLDLNDKDSSIIHKELRKSWKRSLGFNPHMWFCPNIAFGDAAGKLFKEILPGGISHPMVELLLSQNGIMPTEILFLYGAPSISKPYKVVQTEYFYSHQNEYWEPAYDLGIYDESFSWLMEICDDGQVTLAKRP